MAGKSVKLEVGTVYKKEANGAYLFRYQVNGLRKAVGLKTKNLDEALAKARELAPVVKATTVELVSAHIKRARGMAAAMRPLALADAWEAYLRCPERATPATMSENEAYRVTLADFAAFAADPSLEVGGVTPELADNYARHLRGLSLSVVTHNRKIKRLQRMFRVLEAHRDGANPFAAKSLMRKEREEGANVARRLAFSREQEEALLDVLSDTVHKAARKPELRVIFHLGMFTGQRFKDCVLLRWDRIDLNRRRIWVKQFKTGKEVTIPIAPRLLEALQGAQAWKRDAHVCPDMAERYNNLGSRGRNTGAVLTNKDALRVIKWIGLEPSVQVPGRKKKVTVYGFHSLRHSFASHCAEAGVPKAVVLSILGTNSEIVDKYYTHIGEEAQEKAIMALCGGNGGVSDRERLDRVLAFIDSRPEKSPDLQEVERILR